MKEPLQFLLLGLGPGGVYAIVGIGIVLVYRGSGVLNFAHGATALVSAFVFYRLTVDHDFPTAGAIAIAVLIALLIGLVNHLLVMRPLRRASPLARVIATLGELFLLQQLVDHQLGSSGKFVKPILPHQTLQPISGVRVSADRLWLFAIAAAITIVLWVVYRYTNFGLATAAVVENEDAAAALGISPDLIAAVNWSIGAGLAGVAGVLVVPITGLSVTDLSLLVVPAMATALAGSFASFPITFAAATGMGIAEAELSRYVKTPGMSSAIPFVAIVTVLVIRGRPLPLRGHIQDRLPTIGTGRVSPRVVVILAAAALLLAMLTTANWASALTVTAGVGMAGLSVVVVTGYCGQLSLAQVGLAGVGVLVASRLIDAAGWRPEPAILAGIGASVLAGLAVGLPSLRTRGANLAIATLGLALLIERVILGNGDLTGGIQGTRIGELHLFGVDLYSLRHPERYAAVVVLAFIACALCIANLRRGRAGRRLIAVRDNERAAAALGVNVLGAKLYAFALGAALAAISGILLAFRFPSINFTKYNVFESISLVINTVIGGVGFIPGTIIAGLLNPGSLATEAIDHLGDVSNWLPLISGVLLIVTVIVEPNGIVHRYAALADRIRHRRSGRAVEVASASPLLGRVTPCSLIVRDLRVRYGGVIAVDGVSLEVHSGEVVGLIGPNGAGKTSLIDAITGFTPYSGRVEVGDRSIEGLSARRRARAGVARSFQSLELFEDLTVRDNLRVASDAGDLGAYFSGLLFTREEPLTAAARRAVRDLQLEDHLDVRPGALPYGVRRRVGIARAISARPSVLLLDEPAAGLSAAERRELGARVRGLAEQWGIAVLMIEHDVELVMTTCDRIVVLDYGRLIAEGIPSEIAVHEEVTAAYLGAALEDDVSAAASMGER